MALLTDGNPNDTEGLRVFESAILDVAQVEAIDLDAKLCLATEEISAGRAGCPVGSHGHGMSLAFRRESGGSWEFRTWW